jgi:protein SCO1/2
VAADSKRWQFLTGDRDYIWNLCKDGFKMPVSEAPPQANSPILHSSRFILVDRNRCVRALYDGTVAYDLEQLKRDLRQLLDEGPQVQPPEGDSH